MSKQYYMNECPFGGSRKLVLMEHGDGLYIPSKCHECKHNFEGQCNLMKNLNKRLDYGYCGIDGDASLTSYPDAEFPVPKKCVDCSFFRQHEEIKRILWCMKGISEGTILGRGLDYGDTEDNPHPNPTVNKEDNEEKPSAPPYPIPPAPAN